jgi:hypothetical protein
MYIYITGHLYFSGTNCRMRRFLLFFLSTLLLVVTPLAHARVKSVRLTIEVPGGRWKAVRLKNLPRDAAVKVEVKTDGPIAVSLVDQANYETYPVIRRPLFQGRVRDKLSFTVKIPAAGQYYLVFDNLSGDRKAKVDVSIRAASGSDSVLLLDLPPKEHAELLDKTLGQIGMELNRLFILEPFPKQGTS